MSSRLGRLAFHAGSLLAVLVCLVAARWQWERAHRSAIDAVPDVPAIELAQFDPTTSTSGTRLVIRGSFDATHQILIRPRMRDGQPGGWVFTPLIPTTEAGDPPPAAWGVIRGWVADGERALAPPAGETEVRGVLVADERRPAPEVTAGDPPEMSSIDSGALAAQAGYPVRAGWLALESPRGAGQPLPLLVGELPGAEIGLNWRNAGYAVQWLAFAGFTGYFWNRFRIDYFGRDEREPENADPARVSNGVRRGEPNG
ncbi:MAG: SURF1 family protein [Candidatus Nanopelagicales bacterium]